MSMATDDSLPLTILCEAQVMNGPKQHVIIEFEFGDVVADHTGMWVRLRADSYIYETGRLFYWWNIRDFADGLARIQSELKGSCTLSDWDSETILCLSVLDSVHGRIGIRGQLNQLVFDDDVPKNDDLVFPEMFGRCGGIVVSFAGLVVSDYRAYLPRLTSGLRHFLDESGIEHRPPWP